MRQLVASQPFAGACTTSLIDSPVGHADGVAHVDLLAGPDGDVAQAGVGDKIICIVVLGADLHILAVAEGGGLFDNDGDGAGNGGADGGADGRENVDALVFFIADLGIEGRDDAGGHGIGRPAEDEAVVEMVVAVLGFAVAVVAVDAPLKHLFELVGGTGLDGIDADDAG